MPILSATQTTRNILIQIYEDTSESFYSATADFMFALISTEELEDLNQITKQLKNRYNDPTLYKRFVLADRAKMRLYDVEQSAQDILDAPVFDNTNLKKE